MTCEEALLAISAALDGELPPKERAKLSEHLLSCPECRELAADLRVLADALEDSDREPPAELSASVRAAVAGEARRSRPPYLRAAAAMLALCVGLGCIGLFVSGRNGMKGGSAGGVAVPAPALYQAPPENMERSADAGCDDMMEDADVAYGENGSMDKAEPDAPMEAAPAPAPSEEGAPIPMPSIAPESPDAADPNYEGFGDGGVSFGGTPEEDAPAAGEGKMSLAPEEAEELAREFYAGSGEKSDLWTFTWLGLSHNGRYYLFEVCRADSGDYRTMLAVPLEGGQVLDKQDAEYHTAVEQ